MVFMGGHELLVMRLMWCQGTGRQEVWLWWQISKRVRKGCCPTVVDKDG